MALVKYNNNSISGITSAPNVGSGDITLIKTLSISSSATANLVHGSSDVVFDNTYPIYMLKFINMHPVSDGVDFQFQASTNTGSSYGVTCTTTFFSIYHAESGGSANLGYRDGADLAQSANSIELGDEIGNGNDECCCGTMFIFNPYSNEFVKNFIYRGSNAQGNGDYMVEINVSGYFNTTSAIDALRFKFGSGNIDSGTIKLYGIKDS
tara:strand:+ start:161 stop:787 length:627 start_codon:yes stop_codon:yes gene_type:complete